MINETTIFSEDNTHNSAVLSAIKYLNTYGYLIEKDVSYKTEGNYKGNKLGTVIYRDSNKENFVEIITNNINFHDETFIKITIILKLSKNTIFLDDKISLYRSILLHKDHLDMIDKTIQNILNQFIFGGNQ